MSAVPAFEGPGRLPGPRRSKATGTSTTPADRRVVAAARVLAGESAADVAADLGVDPEQVRRWAHGLSTGGAGAVGGVGVARPGTPGSLRVPVEDYLGVLAHELRTPLAAAAVGLSLLARDSLPAAQRAQIAASVTPRLQQLQQLTDDLVMAVGVTTGTVELQREDVLLLPALQRGCHDAGLPAPRGPLECVEARVSVDPMRLEQLLRVLCTHVLRYRSDDDQDEPVSVRVQLVPHGDAHRAALVTVRVPRVDLSRDGASGFEPFSAAAEGDGNGLALYVLRALVVAHGGQVGIAGQSGEHAASVFWMSLPLAAEQGSTP